MKYSKLRCQNMTFCIMTPIPKEEVSFLLLTNHSPIPKINEYLEMV